MRAPMLKTIGLVVALLWTGPALAQAPSDETVAAARELVAASRAGDQLKAVLPMLMQQLKPAIVQGRPEVARDYDLVMPALVQGMTARLNEMTELIAGIYARTFTTDEMKELTAFYRSPIGQKLLERMPMVAQQSMAAGQRFGAAIVEDLKEQIVQELRKRGHPI